jgi:hypothetical protein
LLKCHTADILTAAAWAGAAAGDYYPTPPSHDRFRWEAEIKKAKYFVLTDLDLRWALGQGDAMKVVEGAGVPNWPIVYTCGTTKVLANPQQAPTQ